MVRNYVRRTNHNTYDVKTIINALKTLRETGKSIKAVAEAFNMKMSSLGYHWRRHNKENVDIEQNVLEKRHTLRVFSNAMEDELLSYLIMCAEVYSTVGAKWIRQLAYEFAVENKIAIPNNWKKHKMAGKDWYLKFKKRHSNALAKHCPESSSFEQIMGSHKQKGCFFHQNYSKALAKYKFQPKDVFILEQKKLKEPKTKEIKQEDKSSSKPPKGKSLVTFIGTISAIGQSIPPFYIFSYTRYQSHRLLKEAPEGCKATSNPTGKMTKKIFVDYLQHLADFIKCSVEKPVLLLVDDQRFHISLAAIKFAKQHGIVILTFSPSLRNRVQLFELCMVNVNVKTELGDFIIENKIEIEDEKPNISSYDFIRDIDINDLIV